MIAAEIAESLLCGIRTYQSEQMALLDLGVYVEWLGTELGKVDANKGQQLMELAMRLAVSNVIDESERPVAVLREIETLAAALRSD